MAAIGLVFPNGAPRLQIDMDGEVIVKVALLAGVLSSASGGLAASVPAMSRSLDANGVVEPHILGVLDRDEPGAARHWGRHVYAHRSIALGRVNWAVGMAATLESIEPEVIDTQGLWTSASSAALSYRRSRGVPLVITPRGMLDPWALRQSALRKRLFAALFEYRHLSSARVVRALNANEAHAIRRFNPSLCVAIVPNGVDPPDKVRVPASSARQPVIQFVGRLDGKKGLEPLLRAWSIVKQEKCSVGWRLQVNGWGAPVFRQSLERLASDLKLDNSFQLGGPIFGQEKDLALAKASGFVLPSYSEGLPMAVLEAWAWGTPSLITSACNLPEGIETGAAMEISTEPGALAKGILEFIRKGPVDWLEMSRASRCLVETRFHTRRVAHDLERLYAWVAGSAAAPEELFVD